MSTRITFVYETPLDAGEFEEAQPHLVATARAIPGFQRIETSHGFAGAFAALLRRGASWASTHRHSRAETTYEQEWRP